MARPAKSTNPTTPTGPDGQPIVVDESAKVLTFFKLGRDIGVVSISAYNGKRALDIRRFYLSDGDAVANGWHPTAKGIRIPVEEAPNVIHALNDFLNAGDIR